MRDAPCLLPHPHARRSAALRLAGISKMELRVGIRKLIESVSEGLRDNEVPPWTKAPVDVKEVDQLFDSLDFDHSGELDQAEVKRALKKLEEGAVQAVAESAASHARILELRRRAAEAQAVADVTQTSEAAAVELSKQRGATMSAALGAIFKKKGHEAVLHLMEKSWPAGGIGPDAFAKHVGQQGLGLRATRPEIDTLFKSLDVEGNGMIDSAVMKAMVQPLMDSADQQAARVKQLSQKSAELTKVTKATQEARRKQQQIYEEADAEQEPASFQEAAPAPAQQAPAAAGDVATPGHGRKKVLSDASVVGIEVN
jgi:Ca2+-binding EF-hand superfamily protein